MKYVLQYFVFDKTGDDILDADAYVCKSEDEVLDKAENLENLKSQFLELKATKKEWKDLGLLLSSNVSKKVLYNSREEQ